MAKSMKVLVLTNNYPTSEHSFYGIFVREQVESLRKAGISVDVFFINGRENRLDYFKAIAGLSDKLRSNHYDIVHAHHTYCIYPLLFAKMLRSTKFRLVLTFHEAEVYKPYGLIPSDADCIGKLVYLRWPKKIALKNADLVISVEDKLAGKSGFKEKVVILPCGVDLNLFQPKDKTRCRVKLALPIHKKIVLFPASPCRRTQKGFDLLEKALTLMQREDITLITGGKIAHENMTYYMCAADAVVQTSRFEASPMVIKEAMACNMPIISTDVGDTRRVIGDTEGCYICERNAEDIAEKIDKALEFNARTKGRDRIIALGLGLHEISRKIIEVYKELVKEDREVKAR